MDEDDSELVSYSQVPKFVGGFADTVQNFACEAPRACPAGPEEIQGKTLTCLH